MENLNVYEPGKNQLTIANRTLVAKGSSPGKLATLHLEDVRDHLKKLTELQDPVDYDRVLNQLHVGFEQGRMTATWLTPQGKSLDTFLLTDTGAQQLATEVLPGKFFSGLKELALMDSTGEKLATMNWAKFASRCVDPRRVRTLQMRVDNDVRRVVRSCHSLNYAAYSNLDFVQDILDNAGRFANMPVVSWTVMDTSMRLRFAANDGAIELKKPIPMIEAWNSEVGLRRVSLIGGMWRLICTNGMGSWEKKAEYHWIHRGNGQRIRKGVSDAFENILVSANGIVDVYQKALDVSIDDAFRWMTDQLNMEGVAQRVVQSAKEALHDPTTTPGGKLASVVDAVTLIAQKEVDMIDQFDLERLASNLLARGSALALKNGNRHIGSD